MNHAPFITLAAGRNDAMGLPFSAWLVAREGADGRALRDVDNLVVYETQAEWLARQGCPAFKSAGPAQLGLFA